MIFFLNNGQSPTKVIEFSFHTEGLQETRILRRLCEAGLRPIVAHPERYAYVQYDPELINRWFRMGCLMQVNRGSLLGRFGTRAQGMAMELVERNFASLVASDAHSSRIRTPWMQDIRHFLIQEFSADRARTLLFDTPGKTLFLLLCCRYN